MNQLAGLFLFSTMAAPNALNPQAPEYIPFSHSNITQILPITSSWIQPRPSVFPTSPLPFVYPNQPLLHVPPYFTSSIYRETSFYNTTSFPPQPQEQYSSSFLPLHPATRQEDGPQSSAPTSPPVATSESAESSVPLPRVIAGRKYVAKPPGMRAPTGRGGSGSSWVTGRGRGRGLRGGFGRVLNSRELSRRGSTSSMHEEIRRAADKSWTCVEKHQMLPLRRDEEKTTVMVKNVPNEYTRWMLVEFVDKHCMLENEKAKQGTTVGAEQKLLSAYDFLYLPIDFRTKKNKGYAFVNFTEPEAVWKFFNAYDDKKWDFSHSFKVIRIVCARIQGKEALVKHFQKSNFECESDEFLPLCFSPPRDGSGDSVKLTTIGNRGAKSQGFPRYP